MTFLNRLKMTQIGEFTHLSKTNNLPFEQAYICVRDKEGRLLSDEQVRRLPYVEPADPHCKEWHCRQHSTELVLEYLQMKTIESRDWVLDIGCGNGWFSHLLAKSINANVLAIDINQTELKDAARIFQHDNLYFAYLDLLQDSQELVPFKHIFLNSCFQYFEQPKALLDRCLQLLTQDGEIHIIDTPIYSPEQVHDAKQRSEDYYQGMDASAMTKFYHHQSSALFDDYKTQWMYTPPPKSERIGHMSPFPWLRIVK